MILDLLFMATAGTKESLAEVGIESELACK